MTLTSFDTVLLLLLPLRARVYCASQRSTGPPYLSDSRQTVDITERVETGWFSVTSSHLTQISPDFILPTAIG